MPDLKYDVTFPFPAARLELALGLRGDAVRLREYAIVIEAYGAAGEPLPNGMLNWGFSAPLKGCYQYVPGAPYGGVASIPLQVLADAPLGSLSVRVVPWRLEGSSPVPGETFDQLVVSYSSYDTPTTPRFVTVGRSTRV